MNATRQFTGVQPSEKIAVNTSDLQAMLGCGRRSAVQMGNLQKPVFSLGSASSGM